MNESTIKAAARTRRFEAELAEVLGVEVEALHEPVAPQHGKVWLMAATAVLAALVTVAVALQKGGTPAPLQEPVAYEPPSIAGTIPFVQNAADFDSYPATQAAFVALVRSDQEDALDSLRRFTGLRSLLLMGDGNWGNLALAPLGELPALESLQLPIGSRCTAEQLAALLPARRLRFLQLSLSRPLRANDIAVLRRLPALTTLTLSGGALDIATVRELATIPAVGLALNAVDGCSEDVLVELRAMHQLRHFELGGMGVAAGSKVLSPDHVGLTVRVAKALAELPMFESLVCRGSAVDPAALAALPSGLRRLGLLGAPHLGADVFAAAARWPGLQCLMLDPGDHESRWVGQYSDADTDALFEAPLAAAAARDAVWAAQAALLRTLPLRELRYHGPLPPVVRQALAGRPLRSLWLERGHQDLGVLAELPDLTELTLDGRGPHRRIFGEQQAASEPQAPSDPLQPLAAAKKLRQLNLRWAFGDADAIRQRLPGVTVTTHGF
jgi:hypothetical protein